MLVFPVNRHPNSYWLGRKLSLEHRAKIGAAFKGRKLGPRSLEHCAKISAAKKGHITSAEQRVKISMALRGRVRSLEHRARLSAALKGKVVSPDTLEKMSTATKNLWKRPSWRKKMIEARARRVFPLKDTAPEVAVQVLLSENKVPFVTHKEIPGARALGLFHQYDLVLFEHKIAIEMNGCYWHGCLSCFGQTSELQLKRRLRDEEIKEVASRLGWTLVTFWEHQLKYGPHCASLTKT